MKIGVLGGTFDPIHNGHIAVAEEVRASLDLAEVLFVPAGQPWLKEGDSLLAAQHRVQMVRLGIADRPYFKLSLMEVEREGPSYAVETVVELKVQLGAGAEIFFILGYDGVGQLSRWHEPARLVSLCRLVAVPRPGYVLPALSSLEAVIPGLTRSLIVLDKPEIDISATEIRDRVARGLSLHQLVPEQVEKYIRQQGLYLFRGQA